MRRSIPAVAAALLAGGTFAAPELLAPPRFGDPTVMCAASYSNMFDVATAYFTDDRASNFTAIVWMKWTPRRDYYFESDFVPFVISAVSADPARATREGGDELPDLQTHRYDTPLRLVNGTWSETCLTTYAVPESLAGSRDWPYGCYCVNIETDTALTLNVGGAEKSISASPEKQIFNIMASSASRAVSIAAASANATVKFGIAENPLAQFVGAQFDNMNSSGSMSFDQYGGLSPTEWRMIVVRGRIAAGSMTVHICGYNATAKLQHERTSTQELWHPRATFARNARLRLMVANVQGGTMIEGNPDVFTLYGYRVFRGWFDDATIERIRDLDAAELQRRGM